MYIYARCRKLQPEDYNKGEEQEMTNLLFVDEGQCYFLFVSIHQLRGRSA